MTSEVQRKGSDGELKMQVVMVEIADEICTCGSCSCSMTVKPLLIFFFLLYHRHLNTESSLLISPPSFSHDSHVFFVLFREGSFHHWCELTKSDQCRISLPQFLLLPLAREQQVRRFDPLALLFLVRNVYSKVICNSIFTCWKQPAPQLHPRFSPKSSSSGL